MADPADIYAVIALRMTSDAPLTALLPDGVFRDVAPAGVTRAVIISKQADGRAYMFNATAYEEFTYMVKAVHKSTIGTTANQAAARIKALLHEQVFAINGYTLMNCQVAEDNARVEFVEVDPDDSDARWQHRGWLFDVTVSPT